MLNNIERRFSHNLIEFKVKKSKMMKSGLKQTIFDSTDGSAYEYTNEQLSLLCEQLMMKERWNAHLQSQN
jgi:hypothetical protein